jgi:predicted DNA-binding ribbon-helix-helix protein
MNSTVKKRSIVIGSHKTSISLEDIFWTCLKEIARERATTVSEIIGVLDASYERGNLSSTIRLFVLEHYLIISGVVKPQRDGQTNLYEARYS